MTIVNIAFGYCTHNRRHNSTTDPCLYAALLKLALTRDGQDGTGEVHGQWRQQRGQMFIEGVWLHVISAGLMFEPSFNNACMVLPSVFNELEDFRLYGHSPPDSLANIV